MHCKSYSHFCSKKYQNICVSLDVNFNESLTNDIVSFEQLGLDGRSHCKHLGKVLLMSTHNIHFCEEIRKKLSSYPFLSGAMLPFLKNALWGPIRAVPFEKGGKSLYDNQQTSNKRLFFSFWLEKNGLILKGEQIYFQGKNCQNCFISFLKRCLFLPFREDPFSQGILCVGKRTGSHKSKLPCENGRNSPKCIQSPSTDLSLLRWF